MKTIKKALLSHKLFLGAVIAFTAGVLGLLLYLAIRGVREPGIRDIMSGWHYRPAVVFPLTLYASGFSQEQLQELQEGADAWRRATDGKAEVKVIPWVPDDPWEDLRYQYHPKYTVWLLDGNNPRVASLFVRHSVTMGGLCKGHYIGIMKDDAKDNLRLIFKHELGHLMGLEHIRPEYPALMNLKSRGSITKYDLLQFEYLYEK